MNGASVGQGINADDLLSLRGRIFLRMPFGMPGFDGLPRHPRGEALIQPDVVPPGRGDQIPEPLMGNLVRDGDRLRAFAEDRCALLIEEQHGVTIEDRRRILHAAPLIIGDREHIKFPKWVLDAIPLVVELKGVLSDIQREGAILFSFRNSANPNWHSIHRARQALPVSNRDGHQIAGHLWGCREGNLVPIA